jgi:hypothetical protein
MQKKEDYWVIASDKRLWFHLPVSNATGVAKRSWAIRTTPHMGRRITGYTTPQAPDKIRVDCKNDKYKPTVELKSLLQHEKQT